MPIKKLSSAEYDDWLDREITDPEKLNPLYKPYPAELMEMYPLEQKHL
jgi:putative SOS response-associated peptidase YedK